MALTLAVKLGDSVQQLEADELMITDSTGIVFKIGEHPVRMGGLRVVIRGDVTAIVAPNAILDLVPSVAVSNAYI